MLQSVPVHWLVFSFPCCVRQAPLGRIVHFLPSLRALVFDLQHTLLLEHAWNSESDHTVKTTTHDSSQGWFLIQEASMRSQAGGCIVLGQYIIDRVPPA